MNKPDLSKFGTAAAPLRASSIPMLLACPWRAVMVFMREYPDFAGIAADTGSAVHKAIEVYHRDRKSFDECLAEALNEVNSGKYPRRDADDTRLHFRGYYDDPRNRTAKIIKSEEPVEFTVKEEETEVTFQGTFDQIRLDSGQNILYDIKTGKSLEAWNLLQERTLQLACYWIGAREKGIDVDKVGIIYTYGYRKRGYDGVSGVFLLHPMRYADCHTLIKGVIRQVKAIRAGQINVYPGAQCSFCPASSVSTCLPLLKERVELGIRK